MPDSFDNTAFRTDMFKAEGYSGTPQEIRKAITYLLKEVNFAVALSPMKSDQLTTLSGGAEKDIDSYMAVDGIRVCNIETGSSSDYTYPIRPGQPVCLSYLSGNKVTGVNPEWGQDEYRIIGHAMSEPGASSVVVRLESAAVGEAGDILRGKLDETLYAGDQAVMSVWKRVGPSEVDTGINITVRDWCLRESGSIAEGKKVVAAYFKDSKLYYVTTAECP